MSFRARRLEEGAVIERFSWSGEGPPMPPAGAPMEPPDDLEARITGIERDAFAKGYEQGERAGLEAGAARTEAMLRRLTDTIEQLAHLRKAMIRQTEEQMVRLALAMAKRVVRREISLDQDFALAMARVALDRLGERTSATIKLHPDDFAIAAGRKVDEWAGSHVSVVADAAVSRGGCVVESDLGTVDGTIEAQFDEIARAVLVHETDSSQAVTAPAPPELEHVD